MEVGSDQIAFGSIGIDPETFTISHSGDTHKISPRDMDVFLVLVEKQGRVVTRDAIMDEVWGDVVVNDEAVSLSVSRLRAALGENAKEPRIIQTIPKRGYKAVAPGRRWKASRGQMAFAIVSVLLIIMTMLFIQVQSVYHEIADVGL